MHRLTGLTRWGFLGKNLFYLMSKPKAFDTWTPEQQEAWREIQRKYVLANRQKPESIAKQKAYLQKPEVIAKRKAYLQTPEYKAKRKAYHQTLEVIAKRKAYQQKPEYIAEQKAYQQKPEVIARQKAYYKDLRQQASADQFFIMAGAAEQISKIIQTKEIK